MSVARQEVLARVRRSLGDRAHARVDEYASIRRAYVHAGSRDRDACLALLGDRLRDYGADVYRSRASHLSDTIAEALRKRAVRSVLVPSSLPPAWIPADRYRRLGDEGLSHDEIDRCDGVVTGCAVAIAATGTIVLRHSPRAGRREVTLLPDYHLCIVWADQVVETVPEAVRLLETFSLAPITMISGPSATSDIEMTRIQGVHGPRMLDVVLADR